MQVTSTFWVVTQPLPRAVRTTIPHMKEEMLGSVYRRRGKFVDRFSIGCCRLIHAIRRMVHELSSRSVRWVVSCYIHYTFKTLCWIFVPRHLARHQQMPSMSYFIASKVRRFSSNSNHVNKSMSKIYFPRNRAPEYQKAASGNGSEVGKTQQSGRTRTWTAECKMDPKWWIIMSFFPGRISPTARALAATPDHRDQSRQNALMSVTLH